MSHDGRPFGQMCIAEGAGNVPRWAVLFSSHRVVLFPFTPVSASQAMMKDQFGNYVVQKVLETCNDAQRELLLGRIRVHLHTLKKFTYGKHIVARVEKLLAAGGETEERETGGGEQLQLCGIARDVDSFILHNHDVHLQEELCGCRGRLLEAGVAPGEGIDPCD